MVKLVEAASLICVSASLLLQLILCFFRMNDNSRDELSRGAKQASTSGLIIMVIAWFFGLVDGQNTMAATLISRTAFAFALLFIIWIISAFNKNFTPSERTMAASLRRYSAVYSVLGFVLALLLR